ncbi:hypothetical protein FRB94_009449 [Tulasnella sp. JGI-2019a]|nr:hypothetical protein FRB93_008540 [Tulasnella sp. JGI-2019a]KAG8995105.1 hypothetical protein FRB94_009449 [Tulasnella sp. JGI-2019a]KAG9025802.1 hypothetical protein FRB95_009776 [Tulasnella sp. JGI-2019a]
MRDQLIAEIDTMQPPQPSNLSSPEQEDLLDILPTVLATAADLREMKADKTPECGQYSEMNWREPIGVLLRQIFKNERNSSTFRYEVSIHMPHSRAPIKVCSKDGARTTTDAGWLVILREYYLKAFQSPHETRILENKSILTSYPGSHLSILLLACEFKTVSGGQPENQVMYDPGAAQEQLRALGVTNRILYGLACSEEKVKVMWSKWSNKLMLLIGTAIQLDMTKPSNGIRLFRFLRSIREDRPTICKELDSKALEDLVECSTQC